MDGNQPKRFRNGQYSTQTASVFDRSTFCLFLECLTLLSKTNLLCLALQKDFGKPFIGKIITDSFFNQGPENLTSIKDPKFDQTPTQPVEHPQFR